MAKINVLDESVFTRIAAGEVVERPASIVKELVENALDAGATEIKIEITNGGIDKIRITDNGCGIEPSEIEKAFLPHATSKIKSCDDLESIKTLGFRGEALASIASVSEVEIVSKTNNYDYGMRATFSAGKLQQKSETASVNGTTIVVNNVFHNVPARLKFLKKPSIEEKEITNFVAKLILANPSISFSYLVNSLVVYKTQAPTLFSAISTVYGSSVIPHLTPVHYHKDEIIIDGYISKPSYTKPNRTYQTLIVNGRYVQNYFVSSAVQNACEDFLMKGQFPFYVLNLSIPFDEIDVNVHPSKLEIKFEKSSQIFSLFSNAVFSALNEASQTARTLDDTNIEDEVFHQPSENDKVLIKNYVESDVIKNTANEIINSMNFEDKQSGIAEILINEVASSFNRGAETLISSDTNNHAQSSIFSEPNIKIAGTIFNTYIIVECNDDVFFIDQHAAHERQKYDLLINKVDKELPIQALMVPYIISVNPVEHIFLTENSDVLEELGIKIEDFGVNAIKVSSVPSILAGIDVNKFFASLLKDVNTLIKSSKQLLKNKFAQMACKSAVKAGQQLSLNEIDVLIKNMENQKTPLLCPHGRPIIIKFSKSDIEKWFKRIV